MQAHTILLSIAREHRIVGSFCKLRIEASTDHETRRRSCYDDSPPLHRLRRGGGGGAAGGEQGDDDVGRGAWWRGAVLVDRELGSAVRLHQREWRRRLLPPSCRALSWHAMHVSV